MGSWRGLVARLLSRSVLVAGLAAGCGLVDFAQNTATDATDAVDATAADGPGPAADADIASVDAQADAAAGGLVDASLACPADMLLIPATSVCIDQSQRGALPWGQAAAACNALGRRLCTDAEWLAGCTGAAGLLDATDDWEWVSDVISATDAVKRGSAACTARSSHAIVDPYGVRCCAAAL